MEAKPGGRSREGSIDTRDAMTRTNRRVLIATVVAVLLIEGVSLSRPTIYSVLGVGG